MSSSPRTALTGVPSGARTVSGTPKNARKYSEAESSNISEPTLPSCHAGQAAQENSTTWPSTILICFLGSGLDAGPAATAPLLILNRLPWQGQSMVPPVTWSAGTPRAERWKYLSPDLSPASTLLSRGDSIPPDPPGARLSDGTPRGSTLTDRGVTAPGDGRSRKGPLSLR